MSRGPLDLALLQLERPLDGLAAIQDADVSADTPEGMRVLPEEGSAVAVIGHALFGPQLGLDASVTAGVLSRAVGTSARSEREGRRATTSGAQTNAGAARAAGGLVEERGGGPGWGGPRVAPPLPRAGNPLRDEPVLLTTTATVNRGCSGGAVVGTTGAGLHPLLCLP